MHTLQILNSSPSPQIDRNFEKRALGWCLDRAATPRPPDQLGMFQKREHQNTSEHPKNLAVRIKEKHQ